MTTTYKTRRAVGAPSFCWQCRRDLTRMRGRGLGEFVFVLVRDPIGHEHRVHAVCAVDAVADGAVVVEAPTA